MLSIGVISAGSASAFSEYHESEAAAARDDYYSNEGDRGSWYGGGAAALGFAGELERGQLKNILEGYNPQTGRPLARNAGPEHKCGWDLAFSAPKSVSLVWALGGEDNRLAIEQAQARSARVALDYLEKHAITTRSRAGDLFAGGIVAALYQHGTSREGDPQLHTHAVVANTDAAGLAIDIDTRQKMAAGAIYRAQLASELQKIGYKIESDKSSFCIAGIDPATERHFSQRRQQIEAEMLAAGYKSARAASIAALSTRQAKQIQDREQQIEAWRQAAKEQGISAQTVNGLRTHVLAREAMPAAGELLQQITAQASTVTDAQLVTAVAQTAQGRLDAAGIESYLSDLKKSGELVRLVADCPAHRARYGPDTRWTSREMLEIESGIVNKSLARSAETSHVVDASKAITAAAQKAEAAGRQNSECNYGASTEQIKMIEHICVSAGAVKCVQGLAGTGKSYALGIAREAWEKNGNRVIGCALAGKAADSLKNGAGIESITIHSLLLKLENSKEKLTKNDVIVIDEAGMVGSRLLAKMLDAAHSAGAKVVLVGDSKQLQPIDAGGAFRALTEKLGAAELRDITRQNKEIDRQVVRDFAAGDAAKAIRSLDERGLIKTNADKQALKEHLVADFMQHRDPNKPGESLMLAATRADVRALNELAREHMKNQNRICNEHQIETTEGKLVIAEGDRILFKKNDKSLNVKNGQLASVERIYFNKKGELVVTAKIDDGQRVQFSPGHDAARGEYADIRHGYAVSVHAAQGVTVDRTNVLIHDSMSDREWSYVAASRARIETRLFCTHNQKSELTQTMNQSHQKSTSLDYKEFRLANENEETLATVGSGALPMKPEGMPVEEIIEEAIISGQETEQQRQTDEALVIEQDQQQKELEDEFEM